MYLGLENGLSMFVLFISLIISLIAQIKINSNYGRYSKTFTKNALTGQEVARKILDANGLQNIHIVKTNGQLTDHYDPKRKVVRLSEGVYDKDTIAAVSVAAHEVGHAIQDKEEYKYMKIRSSLVPVVNLVTYAGYFVAIISLIGGLTGYLKVSIFMIFVSLIFQLITLPVEFNASRRAKDQLLKLNLVSEHEITGVDNMLSAAAMTYVASVISSILQLLRLFIMLGNSDD